MDETTPPPTPPRGKAWMLRRVAIFLGVFLALTGLEYGLRARTAPFLNGVLNVRAGSALIHLLTPGESVRGRGDRIESATTSIQVAQGCEGIDVMLMFVAAVVAMPLGWRRKLLAGLAGVAVVYAVNLLRLAGLFYCLEYAPERFESMHVIVGQTVVIVVAIAVFAATTGLFTLSRERV
jgi:exosortase/archaeosortase family protein